MAHKIHIFFMNTGTLLQPFDVDLYTRQYHLLFLLRISAIWLCGPLAECPRYRSASTPSSTSRYPISFFSLREASDWNRRGASPSTGSVRYVAAIFFRLLQVFNVHFPHRNPHPSTCSIPAPRRGSLRTRTDSSVHFVVVCTPSRGYPLTCCSQKWSAARSSRGYANRSRRARSSACLSYRTCRNIPTWSRCVTHPLGRVADVIARTSR